MEVKNQSLNSEERVDQYLTEENTPISDRIATARSIIEGTEVDIAAKAKAACWLAYRLLQGSRSIDFNMQNVLTAVASHPVETVRARWGLSLRLVWCYDSIIKGEDPRGYLWQCVDWNALKYHPAAAINICKALLLTAILEASAGNKNETKLAVTRLFDAARCGFSRMTMLGGCEASALEVETLGQIVAITIKLLPTLGCDYVGCQIPIQRAIPKEATSIFDWCLHKVIWRLPKTA